MDIVFFSTTIQNVLPNSMEMQSQVRSRLTENEDLSMMEDQVLWNEGTASSLLYWRLGAISTLFWNSGGFLIFQEISSFKKQSRRPSLLWYSAAFNMSAWRISTGYIVKHLTASTTASCLRKPILADITELKNVGLNGLYFVHFNIKRQECIIYRELKSKLSYIP